MSGEESGGENFSLARGRGGSSTKKFIFSISTSCYISSGHGQVSSITIVTVFIFLIVLLRGSVYLRLDLIFRKLWLLVCIFLCVVYRSVACAVNMSSTGNLSTSTGSPSLTHYLSGQDTARQRQMHKQRQRQKQDKVNLPKDIQQDVRKMPMER
jgi:hypothetical protein